MILILICVIIKKQGKKEGVGAMYQSGEHVDYGIHGVCKILHLEQQTVDHRMVTYYVLDMLSGHLLPTFCF